MMLFHENTFGWLSSSLLKKNLNFDPPSRMLDITARSCRHWGYQHCIYLKQTWNKPCRQRLLCFALKIDGVWLQTVCISWVWLRSRQSTSWLQLLPASNDLPAAGLKYKQRRGIIKEHCWHAIIAAFSRVHGIQITHWLISAKIWLRTS